MLAEAQIPLVSPSFPVSGGERPWTALSAAESRLPEPCQDNLRQTIIARIEHIEKELDTLVDALPEHPELQPEIKKLGRRLRNTGLGLGTVVDDGPGYFFWGPWRDLRPEDAPAIMGALSEVFGWVYRPTLQANPEDIQYALKEIKEYVDDLNRVHGEAPTNHPSEVQTWRIEDEKPETHFIYEA